MCLSPITKKILVNGQEEMVTFPCGHCLECVAKYQNEWALRLTAEASCHQFALFCTLKYGNSRVPLFDCTLSPEVRAYVNSSLASLPANRTISPRYNSYEYDYLKVSEESERTIPVLSKSDIQILIKRVRSRLEYYNIDGRTALKYFITGEYGPSTLRPHWHAIIFSDVLPCILKPILADEWGKIAADKGDYKHHFDCSVVRDAHAVGQYVAKYCSKPAQFDNPYVVAGIIPKPCHLISKGIGQILRDECERKVMELCERYNVRYYKPSDLREVFRQLKEAARKDVFPSDVTPGLAASRQIDFCRIVPVPPKEFFGELESIFSIQKMSHDTVLRYSLPRYYKDWLMPQCIYFTTRYNEKKHEYEEIEILRKDPHSTIAEGRRAYVNTLIVDEYNRHISDIMQRLGVDESTAHSIATRDAQSALSARARDRFKRFVKFYNKGYFSHE